MIDHDDQHPEASTCLYYADGWTNDLAFRDLWFPRAEDAEEWAREHLCSGDSMNDEIHIFRSDREGPGEWVSVVSEAEQEVAP
jgi:hypothetical protein